MLLLPKYNMQHCTIFNTMTKTTPEHVIPAHLANILVAWSLKFDLENFKHRYTKFRKMYITQHITISGHQLLTATINPYKQKNNMRTCYHLWMQLVMFWSCVCVSVCLSCSNFWQSWPRNFIFGMQVHLQNILVKLIYQGHWDMAKSQEPKSR